MIEMGKACSGIKTDTPLKEIDNIMKGFKLYKDPELDHFIGGAVGYLSYDLVKYFDEYTASRQERRTFPRCSFALLTW